MQHTLTSRRTWALGAVLAGALLSPLAHANLVKVDGSSTVFPITEAVAEDFQKATQGKIKVTVGISGTGGGFKKFCRGETDISNASRPILEQEMKACAEAGIKFIELPVAYDALTVIIHPKNTWAGELTVADLKKMYEPAAQGKVNNWNQIRSTFPNAPLKLAGAGADSGTFDYFTEAIVGKAKSSRGDYQATEDDNVTIQYVSRDVNAIGYLGLAYYLENKDKVKAVAIKKDDKSPAVLPSLETVNKGTYQPLSRPIFIYVSTKAAERPEVKQFVEYYLRNAAKLSKEVGYVDLPAKAYELALDNFRKGKVGTAFGGHAEVGVSVEELLKREMKH
ncbi:PstS family phosphate ABC transporter substrate-binding protein [Tepidimonas taiwanensis]|uniref:Phosphate-binding protein n=1 Tax=Tepidimonas taiwanensis TaxID=307486 RepID=A0A554X9Q2_9BURK|nr:PstS family phosphate ABC transporter substrate-binding protein [Tepidimonas taiwanensis]MCX7692402.1 PstS family phosphate ABC transporter substrate-binding protein [Tepidimonas taiwanensis]MDM7463670.1 PstS family phosphate ABC transporter substrate-binding protein [Tepidimonas taiwanensis]TSE32572.1 Phosphate-binding protein PstS [Tepidimonas taiwanensis]UBQ06438.1 PstS family phosphate ABC transporter substrate-binding protein [Tepidimonas taiwanensis]